MNNWKACKGFHQSRTLMSEPILSGTKDQAMSRQKLKVAVGLLTDHVTPTAHMFKLKTRSETGLQTAGTKRR
jgi:hypothetical protein